MIDRLVGVEVIDHAGYAAYREQMAPLLARYGGSFVLDLHVCGVLPSFQPLVHHAISITTGARSILC